MILKTQNKLNTLLTSINIKDKYLSDMGSYYLPDVFNHLSEDSYDWSIILSVELIEAIKSFKNKEYFTQEEAHEVILFLIARCYELGATKNY